MDPYSNAQPPYHSMPGAGVPGMPGMATGPGAGMPGAPAQPGQQEQRGKKKPGKAPTRRVVNRQFVVAVAFAVLASGGLWAFLQGTSVPDKYVVTAKGPIATNTEVTPNLLDAVKVPEDLIQPGAIVDTDKTKALEKAAEGLQGVRSQFPIAAKAQIIPGDFGIAVNLGDPLGPDERLVSFRATVAATVAGSVRPGDHVDVYAAAGDVAGALVVNVPVVSVTVSEDRYNSVADAQAGDKNARPSDLLPGDPVPGTYVVRVKADQVGKLVAADASGKIYLAYRGEGATDKTVTPTTAKDAICESGVGLAACR